MKAAAALAVAPPSANDDDDDEPSSSTTDSSRDIVRIAVDDDDDDEQQQWKSAKKKKKRRLPLTYAFGVGLVSCAVLSLQYYGSSGCAAGRRAARENVRQVSDLMCCPTSALVGAVGLTSTSVLALASVLVEPRLVARQLEASLGSCCCCCAACGAGWPAVVAFVLSATGNAVLAVFNLCWSLAAHLAGAFFFFAAGYVAIGLLTFSFLPTTPSDDERSPCCCCRRPGTLALFSLSDKGRPLAVRLLKPTILAFAFAALPVTQLDTLTAEWCAIVAIGLALLAAELDLRRGEALLAASERLHHRGSGLTSLRQPLTTLGTSDDGAAPHAEAEDDDDDPRDRRRRDEGPS